MKNFHLITPTILKAGTFPDAWSHPLPSFIRGHLEIGPDEGEEGAEFRLFTVVAGSGTQRRRWSAAIMSAVQFAIICEVGRYGHAVAPNGNGKKAGPSLERFYWRVTYKGAPDDKTPVNRLWLDAEALEEVRSGRILSDQRPEHLSLSAGLKAIKPARDLCLSHCERLAVEEGAEAGEVSAYIANLKALFSLLDGLSGAALAEAAE